ncbi:unnamed protein product [marine sediment metagenome]|uniref:Uncharacterized protein n=1 Tax=marine sediment metagenome TaxID=412755 RepID=X0ZFU9_9ZZZZ
MGMVERLKGISNWQTVTVICFYIGSVLAITIVAIQHDIVWLIAGGATTLGIVAGSLTGVARQSFSIPSIPSSIPGNPSDDKIKALAQMKVRMADLESEIELLKMNQMIKEADIVCGDEKHE